jgi:hypothetical protein
MQPVYSLDGKGRVAFAVVTFSPLHEILIFDDTAYHRDGSGHGPILSLLWNYFAGSLY